MKLQSISGPYEVCLIQDATWKKRSHGEMIVYASTFQVEAEGNIEDTKPQVVPPVFLPAFSASVQAVL